ncbi:DUF3570 domain-containing protein [Sphaerotilus microaerophilus]|uniref:DUF3570 domain-containing protein n=1 Tax=Sphaerotilus microaerophilus TaxID=2914710 RepID=A0ABM7YPJ9_9BURK|nr:DUF3570 domain-containing protein [Sphaerotilus sp. FB-5]BDI06431.1 hypothetical protein CATMQ487_34010 [Sphaerotilus sp. FB-5]
MAATELHVELDRSDAAPRAVRGLAGSIVAAALALPGVIAAVVPATAMAEQAPEQGVVALKYLNYRESQPGLKRIAVDAPSLYLLAPIGAHWSLEGSAVHDDVSGASPRYYADVSGASVMHDKRNAGDLKVTRYFERSALGLAASVSNEHDYRSRALSVDARFSSADNNTSWNTGLGFTNDRIDPVNRKVNEKRRTTDLLLGVTQAWSAQDLVQANLTLGFGRGYFSDPYKMYDERPRKRNTGALLLRWNHRGENWPGTLRSSYRLYQDSFGVRAHTTEAAWVQPLGSAFTLTPLLRYHTQRAASFYYDPSSAINPVTGLPFYPDQEVSTRYNTNDQRLSAFGALTWGARLDWKISPRWSADLKFERYEQRSGWRLGGDGSPGIAPFTANWLQVGLSSTF